MTSFSEKEALKKRIKVQQDFWGIVGSAEHINMPKLEDALRKEFKCKDPRFIDAQIKLMQTEARIKMENRTKVWIKQPNTKTKQIEPTSLFFEKQHTVRSERADF